MTFYELASAYTRKVTLTLHHWRGGNSLDETNAFIGLQTRPMRWSIGLRTCHPHAGVASVKRAASHYLHMHYALCDASHNRMRTRVLAVATRTARAN